MVDKVAAARKRASFFAFPVFLLQPGMNKGKFEQDEILGQR
jgi:hypothetical protein